MEAKTDEKIINLFRERAGDYPVVFGRDASAFMMDVENALPDDGFIFGIFETDAGQFSSVGRYCTAFEVYVFWSADFKSEEKAPQLARSRAGQVLMDYLDALRGLIVSQFPPTPAFVSDSVINALMVSATIKVGAFDCEQPTPPPPPPIPPTPAEMVVYYATEESEFIKGKIQENEITVLVYYAQEWAFSRLTVYKNEEELARLTPAGSLNISTTYNDTTTFKVVSEYGETEETATAITEYRTFTAIMPQAPSLDVVFTNAETEFRKGEPQATDIICTIAGAGDWVFSSLTFYKNGEMVQFISPAESHTFSQEFNDTTEFVVKLEYGLDFAHTEAITESRTYQATLKPSEAILAKMDAEMPGLRDSLVCWYCPKLQLADDNMTPEEFNEVLAEEYPQFDGGLRDLSGNGYDMTLLNVDGASSYIDDRYRLVLDGVDDIGTSKFLQISTTDFALFFRGESFAASNTECYLLDFRCSSTSPKGGALGTPAIKCVIGRISTFIQGTYTVTRVEDDEPVFDIEINNLYSTLNGKSTVKLTKGTNATVLHTGDAKHFCNLGLGYTTPRFYYDGTLYAKIWFSRSLTEREVEFVKQTMLI